MVIALPWGRCCNTFFYDFTNASDVVFSTPFFPIFFSNLHIFHNFPCCCKTFQAMNVVFLITQALTWLCKTNASSSCDISSLPHVAFCNGSCHILVVNTYIHSPASDSNVWWLIQTLKFWKPHPYRSSVDLMGCPIEVKTYIDSPTSDSNCLMTDTDIKVLKASSSSSSLGDGHWSWSYTKMYAFNTHLSFIYHLFIIHLSFIYHLFIIVGTWGESGLIAGCDWLLH